MLNTSVVDSNWRDRIGTVHSYLYKQFRIALSADRDGDHGYFNVSGKISEIDAVRAMNFFISSPGFRTARRCLCSWKKKAET